MEMSLRMEAHRETPSLTRGEHMLAVSEHNADVWTATHLARQRLGVSWDQAWLLVQGARARHQNAQEVTEIRGVPK